MRYTIKRTRILRLELERGGLTAKLHRRACVSCTYISFSRHLWLSFCHTFGYLAVHVPLRLMWLRRHWSTCGWGGVCSPFFGIYLDLCFYEVYHSTPVVHAEGEADYVDNQVIKPLSNQGETSGIEA